MLQWQTRSTSFYLLSSVRFISRVSLRKKTLLIGKTGCLLGAVPILPGQTLELRCPCANVSCHDGLKRIIVSWCDNPQTPLIDSKAE
uniref:Putative kDa family member n=1 Tax=Rhipicephalus microplus TaxID=6941 RepID=A0A6G5A793_RHIMP